MNCGVITEPGGGKTHSLLTMIPYAEKTKSKIGVIDVEGKFANNPVFMPHIQKGLFEVFPLGNFVDKGTMRDRISKLKMVPINPQGYFRLADAVDKMTANAGEYCCRVIDTFTEIQDHLKVMLKGSGGKTVLEYAEWELMIQNQKLLFSEFCAIGEGKGINLINMHLKNEKDEVLMTLKVLPWIQGQFQDLAASYFHELYMGYVKDNGIGKAPDYMWRVRPNSKVLCRTNVFGPDETDVKQDWTRVWQKLL